MNIFDTHTHLNVDNFAGKEAEEIAFARELGVTKMNIVGFDTETIEKSLALSRQYGELYSTIGWHPTEAGSYTQEVENMIVSRLHDSKVIALGEIGLDYHWEEPEPELQKTWFVRQLGLAREKKLPVIIHSRDAAKDTLDIMKAEKAGEIGGVIHCFSYSLEMAKEYLNMGFYLGIGGVLTFNNAKKLKEVVAYMPLDRIVLETDCPYLSPVPNRGKRNSSLNLPYVVEEISRIKNVSVEQIIEITNRNAKQMYRLSL